MRRILDVGDALHLRLDKIPHLRADTDQNSKHDRMYWGLTHHAGHPEQHHYDCAGHTCDGALDGLARADVAEERKPADAAPHQQGGRVADDDGEDREERPYEPIGLGRVQQQVVIEGHADVESPGNAHRPPPKALALALNDEEGSKSANEGERQHELDVDLFQNCAAEGEESAQGIEQPAGRSKAHEVGQLMELPQRQATQDKDKDPHAPHASQDQGDDGPKEDEGAEDPDHQGARLPAAGHLRDSRCHPALPVRPHPPAAPPALRATSPPSREDATSPPCGEDMSSASGRPPNPRTREPYSASAAFKSSTPTSRQRLRVPTLSAFPH